MWTVRDDALAAQGGGGAWVMLHNQAKGDQPYWWGSKWDSRYSQSLIERCLSWTGRKKQAHVRKYREISLITPSAGSQIGGYRYAKERERGGSLRLRAGLNLRAIFHFRNPFPITCHNGRGSINHCALLTSFTVCNSKASLTFQNVCGESESLLIVCINDIQTTG